MFIIRRGEDNRSRPGFSKIKWRKMHLFELKWGRPGFSSLSIGPLFLELGSIYYVEKIKHIMFALYVICLNYELKNGLISFKNK